MIEIETTWKDTGYDCDHCGGLVLQRTDVEAGQPKRVCYQCKMCGCQWHINGDVLRIGSGANCRQAQRARMGEKTADDRMARRFVWVLALVALLLIVRFGGFMALRLLIPLAFAVLILIALTRFAREKGWW